MKTNSLFCAVHAFLAAVILTACHYDFPAVASNHLPVDSVLSGRWVSAAVPSGKEARKALIIVPSWSGGVFVDLEVDDNEHWYFRAYPLSKDLPGLYQLEWLGGSDGKLPEENPFTIASVVVADDLLDWRVIDPGKVGEVKDGSQLLQRLRAAASTHEDLFSERTLYTPVR